ncbi:MAG: 3-phosphoshikimate 1-carboxyvinyltransferase, partial [Clostridiales bacterium]|nr:3-phosphoshikimate 1-carboxyvinyltransferase [Clostridiales bacterium]
KAGAIIAADNRNLKVSGGRLFTKETRVNVGESGSTLRFLIPLALIHGEKVTFCGSERLMQRPLSVYEDICRKQGIFFSADKTSISVCGKLNPGEYEVAGDISSQFISGLLFALPLLEGDSVIKITGGFESKPYVLMTIDTLKRFGVDASLKNNTIFINGYQRFKACRIMVEGDYSNAAFFDAFNLLGGEVDVSGLSGDSLQGDRVYKELFGRLTETNCEIDLSDCPDLGPVCMALAYMNGVHFTGTGRLKLKESDRCSAMAEELAKFGIKSEITDDTMTVYAGTLKKPALEIDGHNDHRIVMAMSLLLSVCGGVVDGAQAVKKSLPDFFSMIRSLGIEVEEYGSDT